MRQHPVLHIFHSFGNLLHPGLVTEVFPVVGEGLEDDNVVNATEAIKDRMFWGGGRWRGEEGVGVGVRVGCVFDGGGKEEGVAVARRVCCPVGGCVDKNWRRNGGRQEGVGVYVGVLRDGRGRKDRVSVVGEDCFPVGGRVDEDWGGSGRGEVHTDIRDGDCIDRSRWKGLVRSEKGGVVYTIVHIQYLTEHLEVQGQGVVANPGIICGTVIGWG